MAYKQKGEITIFLALILSIMLLFALACIENIRKQMAKAEVIIATDNALKSCFAEYNQLLFDRYHLMYIDPSYKGEISDVQLTKSHLYTYLNENLNYSNEEDPVSGLRVEEICVTDYGDAKENDYIDVKNQINDWNESQIQNIPYDNNLIEYCFDVFGNNEAPKEGSVRIGEMEYLAYGYDSDADNISNALEEYYELIASWEDEEILIEASDENQIVESYDSFLIDKLREMSETDLMGRMIFLINECMRNNGSPAFELGDCIYSMRISAEVVSSYDFNYSINREYSYR